MDELSSTGHEARCGRLWVTLSTGLVCVSPSVSASQRESPAGTACKFGASVTHPYNQEVIDEVPPIRSHTFHLNAKRGFRCTFEGALKTLINECEGDLCPPLSLISPAHLH